jgi:two-component system, NtrC family, sensor histidine kinase KinB
VTLRRRLLLAQVPLAAALLVVGGAALRTVSEQWTASEAILKDNYRSVLAAQRMGDALDELDRQVLLGALGRSPDGGARARETFEAELRVQEGNVTEPGEEGPTRRLGDAWRTYREAIDEARAPDALDAYVRVIHPASARLRAALGEVLDLNQDAMVRKSNLAHRRSGELLRLMMTATAAALALGLLSSFWLTARMVRPLSALAQAVKRFGEGDLESRARPRGEDEIAAVGREFDTMADRLEEYRKSSLGELLLAQQAAQAAIDSLPDPVLILDTEGVVQNLNEAAAALLQTSPGDGVGKPLHAVDPALRARVDAARAHVLEGKGPFVPHGFEEAIRLDLPDGPRHLLPRASALYGAEGTVSGVTLVLQDVTRLLRFDQLKNDLVATVAHEFRTPLTSLHMAIHLCAEGAAGPVTDSQADLLGAARQDCDRLQAIVDDVLDLSRLQAGRIDLRTRPVDVRGLVSQAVAVVEGSARVAGVSIAVEGGEEEIQAIADPERIDVVLANLLVNAVRHAPSGGRVVVRLRAGAGQVVVEVEDDGEGVPSQYLERIFERFFQVPGGRRGGIGLGLYISREIVRAHGGELSVRSTPGEGSTFSFTLPLAPRTAVP